MPVLKTYKNGAWENVSGFERNADTVDGKHASEFASAEHTHTYESVVGLEDVINGIADSKFYVVTFDMGDDGEYHGDLTFAEIREKFEAGGNMVARIDGTDYIPLLSAAEHQIIFSGIYQATSVSLTIDKNDVCTLSSTSLSRSNHNHNTASSAVSGFMSKEDKAKLNGIDDGAEVNVIESISVNGEVLTVTDKAVDISVPEQVNADWNQNDETAADYIKNRPFYDNTEVLVDNITVNNGDTLDFAVDSFGNTGDTVSIIWDGILTDKTIGYCIAISGRWHIPYNTIGNQSYISDTFDEGGDNTGEDYVIYGGPGVSTSTIICDDQSHTLSIVREVLTQIDEKFIPDTIAKKSYVDKKVDEVVANIPSVTDVETKLPITLGAFQYFKWGELPGDSIEEQAQHLARYDVIVYQGALCDSLSMSATDYERDLALYTKALEYNPDLKVFGYVTARGFANSTAGLGHVGMEEYRVSPDNVDHPIWTKEELCAYINLMAHCGGTRNTSVTDEFGNPTLTGGIPLYGVFFDDYDYNFEDDNTHLMNQGDWSSIREKHNFLIDYCHSVGLRVMPNSNPTLIFDNAATPNSVRNPDGIASHMSEDDWFCVESYFLRSDHTFGSHDNWATTYNDNYRDAYKSKCLALSYTYAVSDDSADNEQIANTFAVYQALCQGVDAIALHGSTLFTEIPDEFTKYYDKNNSAVRTSGDGYYSLTVNGHTITTMRSVGNTAYGMTPDSNALATCKVIIDGQHTFNNMYVKHEELVYDFANFKNGVDTKVDELVDKVEQSSNLYQRAFIDDWEKNYTLADYTNHCFTFQNAYGGEDTNSTSSWSSAKPYNFNIYLPKNGSWRRVEMDARHLAGKTVELGFEKCDAYLNGSTSTKLDNVVWQVMGVCESNSWLQITTFNANVQSKSSIDGANRCCMKFTVPEDIQTLAFWTHRLHDTPEGTWIIKVEGSYLVDISEYPVQKTWFTNYAPPMSSWGAMGNWSNYQIDRYPDDDMVVTSYTATSSCYESGVTFPVNTAIFKPGETWEIGFKNICMKQGTDVDVTNKIVIMMNIGTSICPDLYLHGKTYNDFKNMKSATGDDSLIAIHRFTIPDGYGGGMPQTAMYVWPENYVGGDSNGLYALSVTGLYMYKIDEKDELAIRGEEPSDTYISLNRVAKDKANDDLKPDALYIVDDGSMFATDFRGNRININAGINTESTGGSSIYYMDNEVEYPTGNGLQAYNVTKVMLSNEGLGIKVNDIIVASNGTLCKVTEVSNAIVDYEPIGSITGSGVIETAQPDWNQNDETAADYIKNRPFYSSREVLLDTVTVNNGDALDFHVYDHGNTNDILTVVWDGVSHDTAIKYCKPSGGITAPGCDALGNLSYFNGMTTGTTFVDTGEDYLIASFEKDGATVVYCESGSHTLSVIKHELVQINEEFIPDTIARKTDIVDVAELKTYIDEMILGGVW